MGYAIGRGASALGNIAEIDDATLFALLLASCVVGGLAVGFSAARDEIRRRNTRPTLPSA